MTQRESGTPMSDEAAISFVESRLYNDEEVTPQLDEYDVSPFEVRGALAERLSELAPSTQEARSKWAEAVASLATAEELASTAATKGSDNVPLILKPVPRRLRSRIVRMGTGAGRAASPPPRELQAMVEER